MIRLKTARRHSNSHHSDATEAFWSTLQCAPPCLSQQQTDPLPTDDRAEFFQGRAGVSLNSQGSAGRGCPTLHLTHLLVNWSGFSSSVGEERPPRSSHRETDNNRDAGQMDREQRCEKNEVEKQMEQVDVGRHAEDRKDLCMRGSQQRTPSLLRSYHMF